MPGDGETVKFCGVCKGEKVIKSMQRGKPVIIRCRACKGTGYQKY